MPAAERNALNITLWHIEAGTVPTGPTSKKWGEQFKNFARPSVGVADLPGPSGPASPYREYRVAPPPSALGAGPLRVVVNEQTGAAYYSWTHYGDEGDPAFVRIG